MVSEGTNRPISGQIVKRLREDKRWSQGQLAQKSGVKQPHISMIEKGEVQDTSVAKAIRLAGALGVTVEELAGGPAPFAELGLADPDLRLALRLLKDLSLNSRHVILGVIAIVHQRDEQAEREDERRRREAGEG